MAGSEWGHLPRLVPGSPSACGALAPSQAFEPNSFLSDLDRFGIEWEVAGAEQRVPVEV